MLTPSQQHRKQSNLKIRLNQQVGAGWRGVNGTATETKFSPKQHCCWFGQAPVWTQLAVFLGGKPVRDCVLVAALATSARRLSCLHRGAWDLNASLIVSVMPSQRRSSLLGEKQMACISCIGECLKRCATVDTLPRPIPGSQRLLWSQTF